MLVVDFHVANTLFTVIVERSNSDQILLDDDMHENSSDSDSLFGNIPKVFIVLSSLCIDYFNSGCKYK